MKKPLVESRSEVAIPSRRALARDAADRLRGDAASAADGIFPMQADRMRALADLLDSLTGHERPVAAAATPVAVARAAVNSASASPVENVLAALMVRADVRGRDA